VTNPALKKMLMACAKTAFMAGIATASAATVGNAPTSYPLALSGIWFDDSKEGKAQCLAYKNADKTNDDEVSARLVGAVLIRGSMMHAYSEYGEGNFYALRKLEKMGRNSWRAAVAIGIDSVPETSEPVDETLMMRLASDRLVIASKPPPLDIKGSWQVSYNLRYCADMPPEMYRSRAQ
jgi:hypothetical protein